jgi:heme exporter protein C
MRQAMVDAWRKGSLWATLATWPVLLWLTWFVAPDWAGLADVAAPLTRKVLFFHPASAWASFAAYFVVFALSIAVLNEKDAKYDAPARAAAEVGFWFNTVALLTGTFWGVQEWNEAGRPALATVYSEPKVLVVVVLWFTFAAYLLLRRLVDGPERRARLAAAFGVLGFLGVPLSFATSRLLSTSLHPDIAGPGANPDAAVGATVGAVIAFSLVAFLALFLHLWLARLRLLRLEERLDLLETA